jgi:membrane protease YdiL (CAAX protease family)
VDRAPRESYGVVEFLIWPFLFATLLVGADWFAGRRGIEVPDSFSGTLLYAGLASWLLYRARRSPYEVDLPALTMMPRRRSDWQLLAIVLPLVAAGAGALYLVTLAISFVSPETVAASLGESEPGSGALALRLLPGELIEEVIGAIAEEWLFRGVLLHLWARRFGVRFAVLATSLLFAALHADVLGSFIFGIVMAALYVRTGTLLVPIAAHLAFNVFISLGSVALGDGGAVTLGEFREDWWMAVVGFFGAVAAIVAVVRRIAPWPWRLPELPSGEPTRRSSPPGS